MLVGSEKGLEKVKWEMGSRGVNASGPMIFREGFNGGKLQWCETIIAEGTIQPDTPQVFARFIAQKKPNGAVGFNSPSGNLLAGLKLGEMIRSVGPFTQVGKTVGEEPSAKGLKESWQSARTG